MFRSAFVKISRIHSWSRAPVRLNGSPTNSKMGYPFYSKLITVRRLSFGSDVRESFFPANSVYHEIKPLTVAPSLPLEKRELISRKSTKFRPSLSSCELLRSNPLHIIVLAKMSTRFPAAPNCDFWVFLVAGLRNQASCDAPTMARNTRQWPGCNSVRSGEWRCGSWECRNLQARSPRTAQLRDLLAGSVGRSCWFDPFS